MSESENVNVVRRAYELFGKDPYAGRFQGRSQVAGFFEGLGKTAEFAKCEPRDFIAQGANLGGAFSS